MITAIISFLALCLTAAVIAVVVITGWYRDLASSFAMQGEYIDRLEQDKQLLLSDKLDLYRENEQLRSDNDVLTDAIRELRDINKELTEEPEPEAPHDMERLPEGVATNRYDCEGFSFPEGTAQYKLQQLCTTDWETGIRIFTRDNIRYRCVAMGTAYGIDIGSAREVTLNNGYSFPIILADYQHDISFIDPNDFGERFVYDDDGNIVDNLRNYDGDPVVHVLEFIVDLGAIPQAAKEAGGMHGLTIFGGKYGDGGNIAKLKYLGRKWEP